MNKEINRKRLWMITSFVFAISVIIRFTLANFNKALVVYNDELRYFHLSRSLLEQGELLIRNAATDYQKILYSIFIMPSFLFKELKMQLKCIAFLNSIYVSSAVFPVLLLALQVLKKEWDIIFVVVLAIIMPNMAMSMTFMSENIYYPMSLWVCWLIIHELKEKKLVRKSGKGILLGVLGYLLYLNKEIGLAFLMAYFLMEIYYLIQERRGGEVLVINNPRIYGMVFVVLAFGSCFAAMKLSLFHGMGNSYNQMGLSAIASAEKIMFLQYSFICNLMFALIAFMVLPVIFPILQWRYMDQEEKRFLIFSILSLVIIILTISYTISVREDLGKAYIRQHTRYYEPLFMLFMISFVGGTRRGGRINGKSLLLLAGLTALAFFAVKKIGLGSPVDSCMLRYYQFVQDAFPFAWVRALQAAICVGTAIFIIGWKKYQKSMIILALTAVCTVCIMNNILAVKTFWREYKVSEQQIEEWERLNTYLKKENSGVLLILDDYEARCADTFLRGEVRYLMKDNIGKIQNDANEYENFRYIMTYAYIGIKNAEEKMRCGQYALYEIPDTRCIELEDYPTFPVVNYQTRIITAEEKRFGTQSEVNDRKYSYVSGEEAGFLICGPYVMVHPGVYNVAVYYEYERKDAKGSDIIGRLDMKYSEEEPKICTVLNADSNKAELKGIRVENLFDQAEIRVFTTVPGVVFVKAEITRIKE